MAEINAIPIPTVYQKLSQFLQEIQSADAPDDPETPDAPEGPDTLGDDVPADNVAL